MKELTIVFVTGCNRGIGRTLVETYLSRPNHIVIGSVRDKASPSSQELTTLPAAVNTKLVLVIIESSSPTDPNKAIKELEAAGIDHLDVVIANAGGTSSFGVTPLDKVSAEEVTEIFKVNTLGPLLLFQAVKPLLEKSKSPKFVTVSSVVGSISHMEMFQAHVAPAYGIAKTGLNWMTMYVHNFQDLTKIFRVCIKRRILILVGLHIATTSGWLPLRYTQGKLGLSVNQELY